jgi:hypothetical protein
MDASRDDKNLPGAKPAWFFAPDQIRKRAKEWGPGGIDTRFGAQADSRTTFKRQASYYTFGLIWAVHLSILLQTPLNNDALWFLRPEPASF